MPDLYQYLEKGVCSVPNNQILDEQRDISPDLNAIEKFLCTTKYHLIEPVCDEINKGLSLSRWDGETRVTLVVKRKVPNLLP